MKKERQMNSSRKIDSTSLKNGFNATYRAWFMRITIIIFLSIFIFLSEADPLTARNFLVVENEFAWKSSNLAVMPVNETKNVRAKKGTPPRTTPHWGKWPTTTTLIPSAHHHRSIFSTLSKEGLHLTHRLRDKM